MASLETAVSFRLKDRVAVVTGASSGLGRRFARVLASAGAKVLVAARRERELKSLADEIGGYSVVADVSTEDGRRSILDAALSLGGRVDVLVNNAGITSISPAEDEPIATFERVVEVNLVAQFGMCQLVGAEMLKFESGSIVNIASVLGIVGVGQMPQAAYAASKGGLVNLTRELAAQWARRGVRVNALAPAWFRSEMTEGLFASDEGRRWLRRKVPMGREGRQDELDGPLLFLASDASSYVTGQVLAVDGGYTAV